MMKPVGFPAFRDSGSMVALSEVLAVIPENGLVGSILCCDGFGEVPVAFRSSNSRAG